MANKLNPTILSWLAFSKILSMRPFTVSRKELKSIQISVSSSPSNSILKGRFDGSRKKKMEPCKKTYNKYIASAGSLLHRMVVEG